MKLVKAVAAAALTTGAIFLSIWGFTNLVQRHAKSEKDLESLVQYHIEPMKAQIMRLAGKSEDRWQPDFHGTRPGELDNELDLLLLRVSERARDARTALWRGHTQEAKQAFLEAGQAWIAARAFLVPTADD